MLVSEYISKFILDNGVSTVFGYQGGNISFVIDALCRQGIKFVETYNEQGASFAANAYAEITGNFGVAVSSSGPGAINMINGMANAYCDSIPCLFFTGDVNSNYRNKYKGVRQSDFQDVDISSIVKPVVKKVYQLEEATEIKNILKDAMQTMFDGRRGPVVINIAHNLQKAEIETSVGNLKVEYITEKTDTCNIEYTIQEKLLQANKPVILLGNGARNSSEQIKTFIDRTQIPFACTLKALDLYPTSKVYLGFAGNYGAYNAKKALSEADLILVLGARLDIRVISAIQNFERKTIIHVDIDIAELSKLNSCDYIRVNSKVENIDFDKINYSYIGSEAQLSEEGRDTLTFKSFFTQFVSKILTSYTVDVGLHQMAVAKYLNLKEGDRIINSGGLGSMGFALPAAIGCYYAKKENDVVVFCGDGGLQMNIQELEVIRREKLPIKIFVLNNRCLGMIRQYQDFALNKRHYATIKGFSSPQLFKIALAYDMDYESILTIKEMKKIENILLSPKAIIVEVKIPVNDNIQ